jgi:hypothetical protein
MRCKCGHSKWQHINRLGKERGPCCAEKKVNLHFLSARERQRLLAPLSQDKRKRALKVGILNTACNCPFYHEVEIP